MEAALGFKTPVILVRWRRSVFETRRRRRKHGNTSFRPNFNRNEHHLPVCDDGSLVNGQ